VFGVLGATVEHVQILTRLITIVANDVVGVKLYSIFTILSKKYKSSKRGSSKQHAVRNPSWTYKM